MGEAIPAPSRMLPEASPELLRINCRKEITYVSNLCSSNNNWENGGLDLSLLDDRQ